MGLDMFLTRRVYVKKWDHQKPKDKFHVTVAKGSEIYKGINPEKVSYVEEETMYWRKANHIHNWFVKHIQGGKDECQESWVSVDDIKNLVSICRKVLANKDLAKDLLPTAEGFFFGTTEYDEYYFDEIKRTILELGDIEEHEDGDYFYRSSW
jgi:hypothetical protein